MTRILHPNGYFPKNQSIVAFGSRDETGPSTSNAPKTHRAIASHLPNDAVSIAITHPYTKSVPVLHPHAQDLITIIIDNTPPAESPRSSLDRNSSHSAHSVHATHANLRNQERSALRWGLGQGFICLLASGIMAWNTEEFFKHSENQTTPPKFITNLSLGISVIGFMTAVPMLLLSFRTLNQWYAIRQARLRLIAARFHIATSQ